MKTRKFLFSLTAMLCSLTMLFGTACGGGTTDGSADESSTSSPSEENTDFSQVVDFTVDVPVGRDPIVLMLSDPQIIDAAQQRTDDRLGGLTDRYSRANIEDRVLRYIREAVTQTQPDLILIAGDIVYGEFDDSGYATELFVQFMETFQIPWAPVMGNHDAETAKGIDWVCDLYENATHCLFNQNTLTGNGNYTVGITQGGKLLRTFFMMDSNGYGTMSAATSANGHSTSTAGFGLDQIDWYQQEIANIKEVSPQTKLSFLFHIPIKAFVDALIENGFDNASNNSFVNFDTDSNPDTFGMAHERISFPWDNANTTFNDLKACGVDSIFSAHAHGNSMGAKYQGVHLQFGLKTGTYDQAMYRNGNDVNYGYTDGGDPIVGGTVIPVSKTDGTISPYHLETDIVEDEVFAEILSPMEQDTTINNVSIETVTLQTSSNSNALYLQFKDDKAQLQNVGQTGNTSESNVALENLAKQLHYNNEDVVAYKGVVGVEDSNTIKVSLTQNTAFRRSSYIYIPKDTQYGMDTDGNGKVDTIWTFARDFKIVYDPTACVVRESLGGCNGDCASNQWHVYAKPIVGKECVAVSCGYWDIISDNTKIGMAFYPESGQPTVNLGYTGWVNPDDDTNAFKQYIKINGNALPSSARLQGFDQPNGLQLSGLSLNVGDVVTVEKGATFTHNGYTMTVNATLSWTYNGGNSFTCSATA